MRSIIYRMIGEKDMSAKKAAIITITTIIAFILITIGIGSVGAGGKHMIVEDGYGISSQIK